MNPYELLTSAAVGGLPVGIAATSVALGIACAWFTWVLVRLVGRSRSVPSAAWEFEQQRRARLMEQNALYRWFGPLIEELFPMARGLASEASCTRVERDLLLVAAAVPWQVSEYLALIFFKALLVGFGTLAAVLVVASPQAALIFGVLAGWGYHYNTLLELARKAHLRRQAVRKQLPFSVDLMAVLMEAGATLLESLRSSARQAAGHPLGDELDRMLAELDLGRPLREVLEAFQRRLQDETVTEWAAAILNAEQLGTPLSQIMRTQADQMRLKRSQWIEKAVADAQVKMVFPGLLVMCGCLLVVIAPFAFRFLSERAG